MTINLDLSNVELVSREKIKGFLYDKKLHVVSKDMHKRGVGLSYPVLYSLKNKNDDVHFLTLRKISYYINNYLNFKN